MDNHAAAHTYAARGWRVIPIQPGSKVPTFYKWPEAATTLADQIDDWWEPRPDFGVGIVTGRMASGRWLAVIDVDDDGLTKHGAESLADLEATYGPLPDTVECHTGSGGRHLYYTFDAEIRNDAGSRLGRWLDIRGEGGQVLAPPTIHPNGQPYTWEAEHAPDDIPVARAPQWLADLLTAPPAHEPAARTTPYTGEPRPGDRFAAATTWPDLLGATGATCMGTRRDHKSGGTYEVWARPGLAGNDLHISATLYYGGNDNLHVFSSNWPNTEQDSHYTKFGYYAAAWHHGNFQRAAGALVRAQTDDAIRRLVTDLEPGQLQAAPTPDPAEPPPENGLRASLIHWPTFWQRDHTAETWVVDGFVAAGRGHALYAPGKAGKSLLALYCAAAVATGRPTLRTPAAEPRHVLYVDYEMGADDVYERLDAFGYGPHTDLSYLHYALLPAIAPLDGAEGGRMVAEAAQDYHACWVVIDTTARAVTGAENDSDTYRAFYRHTGAALKAVGIAATRLDHMGKDKAKGQRGSSAKNDDVDVVVQLVRLDDGALRLTATHRRIAWFPERLDIAQMVNDDGITTYTAGAQTWPAGTKALVAQLVELNAWRNQSQRGVRESLKAAGVKASDRVLRAALKYLAQQDSGATAVVLANIGQITDTAAAIPRNAAAIPQNAAAIPQNASPAPAHTIGADNDPIF